MQMQSRHNDIHDYCVEHFNEPVIDHLEVVRLVGYGETAVDAYYIYHGTRRGVYWGSAVGGPILLGRLKGQGYVKATNGEEWDDLVRLDSWLALNGAPRAEKFTLDLRHDDYENQRGDLDIVWREKQDG
jgi:hypothetical protein